MIPNSNDPLWTRALSTENDVSSASLATKILLTRLRREVKASPNSIGSKIDELRKYFETNAFAQKDIALL